MKTFVIIACFVALVVAEEKAHPIAKIASECNGDKMPDEDFFAKGANNADLQKFINCFLGKLNLLENDGTFSVNKAKEMFEKFSKESSSFINDCAEKSKGTADKAVALAEIGLCLRAQMMQFKKSS